MDLKILVVEDEISINDILTTALRADGYLPRSAFSSKEAKNLLESFKPNLALLDIGLPDESGLELCKFINTKYSIPIIILTARNDVIDKIIGLELGADDYITKPFNIKEVLTRVKVALRRVEKYKITGENTVLDLSYGIKINLQSRSVTVDGEEVKLKPKEYDLLEFLAKRRKRVFYREELLNNVWGMDFDGNYYKFEVINKSKPIADNIYNRIFEPFVRAEKTSEKQSVGLGLYICSEILKEHNGEIVIENGNNIKVKVKIPSFGNNLVTN